MYAILSDFFASRIWIRSHGRDPASDLGTLYIDPLVMTKILLLNMAIYSEVFPTWWFSTVISVYQRVDCHVKSHLPTIKPPFSYGFFPPELTVTLRSTVPSEESDPLASSDHLHPAEENLPVLERRSGEAMTTGWRRDGANGMVIAIVIQRYKNVIQLYI